VRCSFYQEKDILDVPIKKQNSHEYVVHVDFSALSTSCHWGCLDNSAQIVSTTGSKTAFVESLQLNATLASMVSDVVNSDIFIALISEVLKSSFFQIGFSLYHRPLIELGVIIEYDKGV
jgi:hypothetical protein